MGRFTCWTTATVATTTTAIITAEINNPSILRTTTRISIVPSLNRSTRIRWPQLIRAASIPEFLIVQDQPQVHLWTTRWIRSRSSPSSTSCRRLRHSALRLWAGWRRTWDPDTAIRRVPAWMTPDAGWTKVAASGLRVILTGVHCILT